MFLNLTSFNFSYVFSPPLFIDSSHDLFIDDNKIDNLTLSPIDADGFDDLAPIEVPTCFVLTFYSVSAHFHLQDYQCYFSLCFSS